MIASDDFGEEEVGIVDGEAVEDDGVGVRADDEDEEDEGLKL